MKIKRFDILPLDSANARVTKCLEEGTLVFGPEIELFEKEVGRILNFANVSTCSNGFAALQLLIESLGIVNSKIVVPAASTCVAILNAVRASGNTPAFCELDTKSAGLSHENLKHILTIHEDIALIIHPNHFGIVSGVSENASLGVPLIEDSAQSILTDAYRQSHNSLAKIYSFYPTKGINAIDGGAVVTGDDMLAQEVRSRRYYSGIEVDDTKVRHNLKMNNINCAYGLGSLTAIQTNTERRLELYARFTELSGELGIEIIGSEIDHVPQKCILKFRSRTLKDSFIEFMTEKEIQCSKELIMYADNMNFPKSKDLVETTCSIPFYEAMSSGQMDFIEQSLREFIFKKK